MATEYASDFDQMEALEVSPGGYIMNQDLRLGLIRLTHLLAKGKLRMLAYSAHSKPQTDPGDDTWIYHFCVRIASTEPNIKIVVFGDDAKWRLWEVSDTPGSATPRSLSALTTFQTSTDGSPASATFSAASLTIDSGNDTYRDVRMQITLDSTYAGTNEVYGFMLLELEDSTLADTADFLTEDMKPIDGFAATGDRSYNNLLIKRMLDNVEIVLRNRTRGVAHVYPRDGLPAIGSVHPRAFGPFRMPISPHCEKATAIVETVGEDGSLDDLYMVDFVSAGKLESFNRNSFRQGAQVVRNDLSASDPKDAKSTDWPFIFTDIDVISGEQNDFFLIFTSAVGNQIDFEDFQWRWRSGGCARIFGGAVETDLWVNRGRDPLPNNMHITLAFNNVQDNIDWDADTGTGESHEDFSDGLDVTGYTIGTNKATSFDIALVRHVANSFPGTTNDINIYDFAASPCPDMLGEFIPEAKDTSISDAEASVYEHGMTKICSVWINEEFNSPDDSLGQDNVEPGKTPSSSRIRGAIELINMLVNQPTVQYGISIPPQQAMPFDMIAFGAGGSTPVPVETHGNWSVIPSQIEIYEEPQDSSSDDARIWKPHTTVPWHAVRSATDGRKIPTKVDIDADYLVAMSGYHDHDEMRVKLYLRAYLHKKNAIPPTDFIGLTNYKADRYVDTETEVDLAGGIYDFDDIADHTEWAGFIAGDESGRSNAGYFSTSTQMVAWAQQIYEDKWPWDRTRLTLDLSTFIVDEVDVGGHDPWMLTVATSFFTYENSGAGDSIQLGASTSEHKAQPYVLVIPCISVTPTNLDRP